MSSINQLPNTGTRDGQARVQEAINTQNNLNTEAKTNAAANKAAIEAMNLVIQGLPPPLSAGATALSEGIYTALKTKPLPLDLERAKSQTGFPEPSIDPIKLFAIMIAIAIIKAIWCFIKSILNPLPIIGSFFSLCDPNGSQAAGQILNTQGVLIEDPDQKKLNEEYKKFTKNAKPGKLELQVRKKADIPPLPKASRGKTFKEFMAEKYPSQQPQSINKNPTQFSNLPDTNNSTNTSPQQTQQEVKYEIGNLSSDQIRRLFGL